MPIIEILTRNQNALGISIHAQRAKCNNLPIPTHLMHPSIHESSANRVVALRLQHPISIMRLVLPPFTPSPPLRTPPLTVLLRFLRPQSPFRQIPPPTEKPLITMPSTIRIEILLVDLLVHLRLELLFLPRGRRLVMPASGSWMTEFVQC
jgi:hypothetical protein